MSALLKDKKSQSIVLTGESGSGKTEIAKVILNAIDENLKDNVKTALCDVI